jgi:hypothetical protein
VGNIPAKIIGPHIWLPLCCTVFGILTLSTVRHRLVSAKRG